MSSLSAPLDNDIENNDDDDDDTNNINFDVNDNNAYVLGPSILWVSYLRWPLDNNIENYHDDDEYNDINVDNNDNNADILGPATLWGDCATAQFSVCADRLQAVPWRPHTLHLRRKVGKGVD